MRPSPLLERWRALASSSRPALLDSAGAHPFAQLDARARAIAHGLLDGRTSLAGERVAMLVEPGAAFVESFFGVLLAGGCAVVLSPLHPPAESAYFLSDGEVRAVLASRGLVAGLPALGTGTRLLHVEALREAAPPAGPLPAAPLESDAALQLYTSGTTGKPKGAVITHANVASQQRVLSGAWGVTGEDVLLHCLPLHHVHGLIVALLNVLLQGGCARMVAPFDAARVWEELGASTVFMAVPTIYSKLLAALDAADAPTAARWTGHARALRLATSGSAALPVSIAERWRTLTGRVPLERYGMTEIGIVLSNPLDGERRPGSVGRPLPGVDARVVDEQGQETADTGELWIRGDSVFAGYFRREADTEKSFALLGGERYFRTGDTVARDAVDGSFRILGRSSVDILKSGGYKLSALELEELLREHPAVAEVAVVGLPDEVWGDRVVACVVPRPGVEPALDAEAVRAFAKERVASYKVPKDVVFFPDLPRNALGKVVKPELLRLLKARAASGGGTT